MRPRPGSPGRPLDGDLFQGVAWTLKQSEQLGYLRAFQLTHAAVSPSVLIAATQGSDGEVRTAPAGSAEKLSAAANKLARRENPKREGELLQPAAEGREKVRRDR